MTINKSAFVLLAISSTLSFISCEKEADEDVQPTPSKNTYQPPDLTNLGSAQAIFFNGTLSATNPVVVKQVNPNDGTEEELANLELNEKTAYTTVYSGIPNDLNFYYQEPDRLFRGSASGEQELDNNAKYTIIACCGSLERPFIIKDEMTGSEPGKAYVRSVNLRGGRFVLTIGSLETYLNVGPYTAGDFAPSPSDSYKNFIPVDAGSQKVLTITNDSPTNPTITNNFGQRDFVAGRFYTLINNVKTTNGEVGLFVIEH